MKKCFSVSLILSLYEMVDVHCTYRDNYYMMYASQAITLCTLNVHGAVCQLGLNKTARKNK